MCCCLTENIGLKEVDVSNLPRRSMGFSNLFSISDSCLTDDDHTLGHLEILLPGVCLGKPLAAKARGEAGVPERCSYGLSRVSSDLGSCANTSLAT